MNETMDKLEEMWQNAKEVKRALKGDTLIVKSNPYGEGPMYTVYEVDDDRDINNPVVTRVVPRRETPWPDEPGTRMVAEVRGDCEQGFWMTTVEGTAVNLKTGGVLSRDQFEHFWKIVTTYEGDL